MFSQEEYYTLFGALFQSNLIKIIHLFDYLKDTVLLTLELPLPQRCMHKFLNFPFLLVDSYYIIEF